MSIVGSNVLAGASGGAGAAAGYQIERSLRFNDDDTAYLNRTFASSNRTTWTWSAWLKPSEIGSHYLFTTTTTGATAAAYVYLSVSQFHYWDRSQANNRVVLRANGLFRDPSAWYHLVLSVDYTNTTSTDRARLYVNGVRWTSFQTTNYPTTSEQSYVNAAVAHYIGSAPVYLDGYLAEHHFIDGQALEATDFGEFDEDTGVWNPIQYTGTYGTNGYYLNFNDNTSTTTLGEDASGNSNDWTLNNFSVASGAGNDSLIDTPTNYTASSGNNGGNYCTWNPLDKDADVTLANGNLDVSFSTTGAARTTIGVNSGKWYWEITHKSTGQVITGAATNEAAPTNYAGDFDGSCSILTSTGSVIAATNSIFTRVNGSAQISTFTTNDVIGFALDLDSSTKTLKFYKNGSLQTANHFEIADSSLHIFPCISANSTITVAENTNFGQRPFAYTPPTDHLPLCTTNLPDPTIADSSTAMDISLWTGNGSSQTISGLGFSPDLAWIKQRNGTRYHALYDTVRGATKALHSNATDAEFTDANSLTAFNSDGFDVGSQALVNENTNTYVGWSWDAGANSSKTFTVKVVSDSGNKFRFDDFGTSAVTLDLEEGSTYVFDQSDSSNATHPLRFSTTSDGTHNSGTEYTTGVTTTGTPGSSGAKTTITVASGAPTLYYYCSAHSGMGGQANTNSTAGASNFDGSTQSTVRVNTSAGFSIVSYTGSGSDATIGHGLGATPDFIIAKTRSSAVGWVCNHKDLSSRANHYLLLDSVNAEGTATGYWNTGVNSTTFGAGNGYGGINASGDNYIAYCFAPVEGYSAFGAYTGNGSSDGPFVYTGFRPAFLMTKASSTTGNWHIHDTSRSVDNPAPERLFANLNDSEQSTSAGDIDILSNGFKFKNSTAGYNTNGVTHIYFAFAEHPFKTARAR